MQSMLLAPRRAGHARIPPTRQSDSVRRHRQMRRLVAWRLQSCALASSVRVGTSVSIATPQMHPFPTQSGLRSRGPVGPSGRWYQHASHIGRTPRSSTSGPRPRHGGHSSRLCACTWGVRSCGGIQRRLEPSGSQLYTFHSSTTSLCFARRKSYAHVK